MHFEQGKDSAIATVAWMVVFGDGLHNFIDGLSIGAAFNESVLTGVSISGAVM
jgi:zinc transporter ZupT